MALLNFLKPTRTLYYPGCLTKKALASQELENYKWIFNKLGIDFMMLPNEEVCCGLPILNAGYKTEAKKLAKKNLELFKKHKIKKIITNCPSCYHTFKTLYPKLIPAKDEWNIEVVHTTQEILNAMKKKKIDFSNLEASEKEIVTYHDPCHLGRHEGIYNEPREVILRLGGKIEEMRHKKSDALCCGGGGGMRANFPEQAKEMAKRRVSEVPKNARKVISPCGLCYKNLQSADEKKSEEFSSFVKRKLEEFKR